MSFDHQTTKNFSDEIREQKKLNPALLLAIPSFLDMFEHVFRNISNSMIAPSVSQMLRSSVVVFAALLAILVLKSKLYRHHFFSIMAIVFGLICVGVSEYLSGSDKDKIIPGNIVALGIAF
jgi:drug/metabolite transporter (DMT)-like permease